MSFKVGDQVECVNSEGWSNFDQGVTYAVTGVWKYGSGVDINKRPVSSDFFSDFKLVSVRQEKSEKTPAPKTASRMYVVQDELGIPVIGCKTRAQARQEKARQGGKAKGYTIVVYTPTEEIR